MVGPVVALALTTHAPPPAEEGSYSQGVAPPSGGRTHPANVRRDVFATLVFRPCDDGLLRHQQQPVGSLF